MIGEVPTVAGAAVLAAYLFGSLSFAILVSRAMGKGDPRQTGSGNPGATNMLRVAGKKAAALVLVADLLKGLIPTTLAAALLGNPAVTAAVAIAVCLGHVFPVFFGFRGGKAVATYAGASFGLGLLLGLTFAVVWLSMVRLTRVSSLGALSACLAAPLAAWLLGSPGPIFGASVFLSTLVFVRHHRNIRNLLRGTEGRVGR